MSLAAVVIPLLTWWLLLKGLGVPEMIAKTPAGLVDYLFLAGSAGSAQSRLLTALMETLPITLVGLLAGLCFAFLLALLVDMAPAVGRSLMPVALVTQTMPLVALTPLLVLLLGRGTAVTLWITISVTFFPSFVTIAQGILMVPRSALEVPRALLGVMIAEWLATGKGLGNSLNQSRGYLDYGMIWSVAVTAVIIAVVFYQMVIFTERRVLRRLGMSTVE